LKLIKAVKKLRKLRLLSLNLNSLKIAGEELQDAFEKLQKMEALKNLEVVVRNIGLKKVLINHIKCSLEKNKTGSKFESLRIYA